MALQGFAFFLLIVAHPLLAAQQPCSDTAATCNDDATKMCTYKLDNDPTKIDSFGKVVSKCVEDDIDTTCVVATVAGGTEKKVDNGTLCCTKPKAGNAAIKIDSLCTALIAEKGRLDKWNKCGPKLTFCDPANVCVYKKNTAKVTEAQCLSASDAAAENDKCIPSGLNTKTLCCIAPTAGLALETVCSNLGKEKGNSNGSSINNGTGGSNTGSPGSPGTKAPGTSGSANWYLPSMGMIFFIIMIL